MKIPLPAGLKSIPELPKLRESVVNQMRLGESIIPRPGIVGESSGFGACRGSVKIGAFGYFVMGETVYRRLTDGTMVDVGSLTGVGRVVHDVGIGGQAFLIDTNGGSGYVLTDSAFTQVTDPQFPVSSDIAYIDGYYVACPADGSALSYSDSTDPLNWSGGFFDAELLPDLNVGVRNFKNDLVVMGEEISEVFRTTGNPLQPFQRADGASINVGLVSSAAHIEYGNSFVFLGKKKDHNFGVFAMGSGNADKISNEAVDYILNNEYTLAELKTVYVNRFIWSGVDAVSFHLPRHTLVFYGAWAVFESGIDEDVPEPWVASSILFVGDEYFVGSTDGKIGTLSNTYSDFGEAYAMGFDTFARSERGSYLQIDGLELDCLAGEDTGNFRVSLQMSSDGRTWSDRFWQDLGEEDKWAQRVVWDMPGGLGTYESFAGIRVRTTDPLTFALDAMQANIQ